MTLTQRQIDIKEKVEFFATVFGIDPLWAAAVAMTESSLGQNQKSPTGCRGVFQMSGIAMKDLLQDMEKVDDDLVDIACGVAFLRLLLKRWKSIDSATKHYCDPLDRNFYIDRVHVFMEDFKE
jgi:membrane-bound lytic murein transglycosylase MltF